MTDQEAIKQIQKYKGLLPCARGEDECMAVAIKALEAQIKLKECVANLDNPEFAHLTWSHEEMLQLLKEHVADYTKGVERGESKGISSAGQ